MGKFFEHQDKYSSRISDKINGHNEETDISFYLETSDEAVEKLGYQVDKEPGGQLNISRREAV